MTLYKDKYRVETNRLRHWDYASEGFYFVTICTYERLCLLGAIDNGIMQMSPAGEIVAEEWLKTGSLRKNVMLDKWVVMPNHFHAIIAITNTKSGSTNDSSQRETSQRETSQRDVSTGLKPDSLGSIINQFKSACTKKIQAAGHDFGWQTRYYDHVIRNEKSLEEIRGYIINNPLKWELDKINPANYNHT